MFEDSSAGMLLIIVIVVGIILLPAIFYLLTLQKALERCSSESRTTTPSSVWLMLIPLFNIVWQFILVSRVSESLYNEFKKRNIAGNPESAKSVGIAYCTLFLFGIIPVLGVILDIIGIVCWIVYWVKISGYSNELELTKTLEKQEIKSNENVMLDFDEANEQYCTFCGHPVSAGDRLCAFCGNDLEKQKIKPNKNILEDLNKANSSPTEDINKNNEPGRGTLVLVLGILSIMLLGPFVGIPAWVMGNKDLKKIKNGIISLTEKTKTETGRILGIIGTFFSFGIIVVGIAIVVGINLFNANSISANRDAVISDLNNIAAMAHQYYNKPASMGGGGGSFVDYTIPSGLGTTANGSYSITTTGSAYGITIQGVGTQIVSGSNYVTEEIYVQVPPLADSCVIVY